MSVRIVIVGHGRMGKAIDRLSSSYGCEVVERLDIHNNQDGQGLDAPTLDNVDVAIEFSLASSVVTNVTKLANRGINVVIGTTGWDEHETTLRKVVEESGIGVVHAANFSLGVNIFKAIVKESARLFSRQEDFGTWIHEGHHAEKKDAPSGTALSLKEEIYKSGYERDIDISSTRAGKMPGIHTVGYDGPFDTITLTHTARDRSTFARGALEAARWVQGKHGWFTMHDVLEL